MKILLLLFYIFALAGAEDIIRVATSANMSHAMQKIVDAYQVKYPNRDVRVIIGSSGKLTAQIEHGAPYDLFLSADMHFPKRLYEKGLTVAKPVMYAQGELVLLSTQVYPLSEGLEILTDPSIQKIAVANSKTAPYGAAAKEALQHAGLYADVKEKFVYGESISQTLTYALKAADIGIVAKSALFAPKMRYLKEDKNWKDLNRTLYSPISQGMVIVKQKNNTKSFDKVESFYNFILGSEAQEILRTYGYRVP